MRSIDVNNMKVADLKRELKLRSLPTSGNKNELQERLQIAIETEPILEDSAISGEDLLYEDGVLSDEDDPKILCTEENELLKSPVTAETHLTSNQNEKMDNTKLSHNNILRSPTTVSKKIVLKRKCSTTSPTNTEVKILKNSTEKNTEVASANLVKRSERHPITVDCNVKRSESKDTKAISDLTMEERLELRAKKFGLNTNLKSTDGKISSVTNISQDKQLDILKKRAERFGCVTSKNLAKIDAEEKLLKRKERFGEITTNNTSLSTNANHWAEKAAKRLERFKTTPAIPNITTIN